MTELTADAIYGFTNALLLSRFDSPRPTPDFHKELWDLACSNQKYVAVAAPRGSAKTTALTHSYVLAAALFRKRNFILVVSGTEGQAVQFLGDIKKELSENDELRDLFGVGGFKKETETDLVGTLHGGHEFRILAKGSEQRVRGLKWRNRRPNLIIGDDLEDDELVLNEERRAKFRNWFFQALLPCGSDDCIYRIAGTVMHLDSLLERLMPPGDDPHTVEEDLRIYSTDEERPWLAVKFRAHPSMNDFSSLLWPEKFSEARLKQIRQIYMDQGDPEGYSQEYLNNPIDEGNAYFRKQDFPDIQDKMEPLEYYSGADLAISEKDRRAFTVLGTMGISPSGRLKVVDIRRFRTSNAFDIIDEMLSVHNRYKPELFTIEQENIAKSIGPVLERVMRERGTYLNVNPVTVSQDKMKRARSLQARMKAGMVEFDKDADWFPALMEEMLHFPKGKYADQVDALAHICLALDKMLDAPTAKELAQEEEERFESTYLFDNSGRDALTGY